jgi:hypothetical protein
VRPTQQVVSQPPVGFALRRLPSIFFTDGEGIFGAKEINKVRAGEVRALARARGALVGPKFVPSLIESPDRIRWRSELRSTHEQLGADMISKILTVIGSSAFALALGASGVAHAGNLVTNGNFESYTAGPNGVGDIAFTSPVTDWSSPTIDSAGTTPGNLLFSPGSADTTGVYYDNTPNGGNTTYFGLWGPNSGSNNGLTATSPAGGNFLGLDASSLYNGAISQTINGLAVGQVYQVGFYSAGAQLWTTTGATTEQFQVSLGSQTQLSTSVNNASQGFTGWVYQTLNFTAISTSEALSFLAIGTPQGLPPFMLLDGVTMNSVPEPSALALIGIGLFGVGAASLRRRFKSTSV